MGPRAGRSTSRRRVRWLMCAVGLVLGLFLFHSSQPADAQIFGQTIRVIGEFVRNGTFDYYNSVSETPYGWWYEVSPGYPTKVVFDNGNPVLRIQPPLSTSFKPKLFVWQEIHIPDTTDLATLSLRYRVVPDTGQARIFAQFETDTGRVLANTTLNGPWYSADSGWVNDTTDLSTISGLLDAFDQAFQNGERVRLVIGDERSTDDDSYVLLDDISLWIWGYRFQPFLDGAITFVGKDSNGQYTVDWVRPDGSDRTTVWTYPSSTAPKLWKPAWKPDGTEIAFASGPRAGDLAISHRHLRRAPRRQRISPRDQSAVTGQCPERLPVRHCHRQCVQQLRHRDEHGDLR